MATSYGEFLTRFNGGMITEFEDHFYIDMTEYEPDSPKRSSNVFFNLDELKDAYDDFMLDNWLMDKSFIGNYPIIPIGKTPDDEYFLMLSQKAMTEESAVFLTTNKTDLEEAILVAPDFNSFLGLYIRHMGFPSFKKGAFPLLSAYMHKWKTVQTANLDESDEDTIVRTTAMISLDPKDAWAYNERGIAYRDHGKRALALADFNKTIELNSENALYHYCRGDFILEFGSPRKALIDLDIAVKLEPKDKLYLTSRADAFYRLGKLDKALADCNAVLEQEYINRWALSLRYQVYRAMGEDEKAAEDSKLLDDI